MNKVLAAALIAAVTAACSSNKAQREANPAPCPNAVVLSDAARFIQFEGDQTIENVAYTGEILDITTVCRYFEDEPIDAELELELAFGQGPKGVAEEQYFKYFVAVTRTDQEVIAKEEFVVPVKFDGDKKVIVKSEEIDKIFIPRKGEETSGLNFEIIVGFSITPEQAIYNRSGKSLKFPNIQ